MQKSSDHLYSLELPAMSITTQRNGDGFVVRGLTDPDWLGRVSVWLNGDGSVADMEQYPAPGHRRPVKPQGPIWMECKRKAIRIVSRKYGLEN